MEVLGIDLKNRLRRLYPTADEERIQAMARLLERENQGFGDANPIRANATSIKKQYGGTYGSERYNGGGIASAIRGPSDYIPSINDRKMPTGVPIISQAAALPPGPGGPTARPMTSGRPAFDQTSAGRPFPAARPMTRSVEERTTRIGPGPQPTGLNDFGWLVEPSAVTPEALAYQRERTSGRGGGISLDDSDITELNENTHGTREWQNKQGLELMRKIEARGGGSGPGIPRAQGARDWGALAGSMQTGPDGRVFIAPESPRDEMRMSDLGEVQARFPDFFQDYFGKDATTTDAFNSYHERDPAMSALAIERNRVILENNRAVDELALKREELEFLNSQAQSGPRLSPDFLMKVDQMVDKRLQDDIYKDRVSDEMVKEFVALEGEGMTDPMARAALIGMEMARDKQNLLAQYSGMPVGGAGGQPPSPQGFGGQGAAGGAPPDGGDSLGPGDWFQSMSDQVHANWSNQTPKVMPLGGGDKTKFKMTPDDLAESKKILQQKQLKSGTKTKISDFTKWAQNPVTFARKYLDPQDAGKYLKDFFRRRIEVDHAEVWRDIYDLKSQMLRGEGGLAADDRLKRMRENLYQGLNNQYRFDAFSIRASKETKSLVEGLINYMVNSVGEEEEPAAYPDSPYGTSPF